MGIIFTPLLIIVAGTGIYFYRNQDRRTEKAQAFLDRYGALIRLLSFKRHLKILRARSHSATISIRTGREQHLITFSEVDERLIIVWKLDSPLFGKHGKEWSFNPNYSQNRMYDEVSGDVKNYLDQLKAAKGLNQFTTA